jgi:hypothetical protein
VNHAIGEGVDCDVFEGIFLNLLVKHNWNCDCQSEPGMKVDSFKTGAIHETSVSLFIWSEE